MKEQFISPCNKSCYLSFMLRRSDTFFVYVDKEIYFIKLTFYFIYFNGIIKV